MFSLEDLISYVENCAAGASVMGGPQKMGAVAAIDLAAALRELAELRELAGLVREYRRTAEAHIVWQSSSTALNMGAAMAELFAADQRRA